MARFRTGTVTGKLHVVIDAARRVLRVNLAHSNFAGHLILAFALTGLSLSRNKSGEVVVSFSDMSTDMMTDRYRHGGEEPVMLRSNYARFVFGVAVVGLLLFTVACGGGGSQSAQTRSASGAVAAGPETQSFAASNSASSSVGAAPAAGQSVSSTSSTTTSWDRKIIRNADLSLQVTSVESMLATVRTIADGVGGIVFASSTSYDGNNQIASMTIDVPADQFDIVVNELRSAPGVKKVERESITSQDVTDSYVDLQSQLRNLQATEARLMALMDKATNMQDILALNKQLSDIEGQIEQTTGRINYLDKKTSFSRITLTIKPFVAVAETTPKSGFNLGAAVRQAWEASLQFTGGVLTGLVKVGVFMWWFWPLVLASLGFVLIRRQRRKNGNVPSEVAVP